MGSFVEFPPLYRKRELSQELGHQLFPYYELAQQPKVILKL